MSTEAVTACVCRSHRPTGANQFSVDAVPAAEVARELALFKDVVVQARFRVLKRWREEAGELMS